MPKYGSPGFMYFKAYSSRHGSRNQDASLGNGLDVGSEQLMWVVVWLAGESMCEVGLRAVGRTGWVLL